MRRHVKNLFLLFALAIVGVVGWYLTAKELPGTDALLKAQLAAMQAMGSKADGQGQVTGITLVQYNGDHLQWQLSAPGANQGKDGWTEISQPRLTLYPSSGGAIYLTAQTGWVHPKSRNMIFEQSVTVTDQLQRRLTTESLRFSAKDNSLATDRAFKMVGENMILEGVGLRLLKQAQELHVLSRVRLSFPQGLLDRV
uniref:LPS export ABC transporter periplasmic protein LptC n=1 Tax=Magnetococcus massalia (strain MO-1) TaxID=451514 RepID=A0A1S7LM63_MAGMO|nr:Conserved exported protein of unknown function [Candidatus Magnetococcus massalia]